MFQKKRFAGVIMAACFAVAIGSTGIVSAGEISIAPEYWQPGISGNTKATTEVKFKDDLGLEKPNLLNLKLNCKTDDGMQYFLKNEEPSFKANRSLPRSFSFNGGNYIAGDSVNSELKIKHFQFGIRNEKTISSGKVSTIYSFNHNSIKTGIQDVTRNFNQNKENSSNSIGLGFGWESTNAKGVNFFAEATVLSLGQNGGYNDYMIGIKSKIGKEFDLSVGYKGERIEAGKDKNSDYTKADLKGVFVTIGRSF